MPAPRPEPPIKLAVAQLGEVSPPKEFLETLESRPDLIAEVIEVPFPLSTVRRSHYGSHGAVTTSGAAHKAELERRVQAMLDMSSKLGATHALLVGGHIDTRVLTSPMQILDIAILPMFIIPSKKVEIEAKASGALVDLDSESVVYLMNTTAEAGGITPSAYADQKGESMSITQREKLSRQLATELLERLEKETIER